MCEEPTMEALCKLFLIAQPALGIFTDEGGLFVGGHAMKDDNHLATITGLSKFWDGETVKRIRAGEGNSTIAGKRLAMHLMMQPMVAHTLFKNELNRNQGFLARVLIMQPESTMGERLYKAPPPEAKATIDAYHAYVLSILQTQPPKNMNHEDELEPRLLCLTPQAKMALIAYHDAVEVELGEAGQLHELSGFGAKLAEHAVRLAGVMAFMENPAINELDETAINRGIELARYYQAEALRLNTHHPNDEGIRLGKKLLDWLQTKWEEPFVSTACIQNKAPYELRTKALLDTAIETLVSHGWLVPIDEPVTIAGKLREKAYRVRGAF